MLDHDDWLAKWMKSAAFKAELDRLEREGTSLRDAILRECEKVRSVQEKVGRCMSGRKACDGGAQATTDSRVIGAGNPRR